MAMVGGVFFLAAHSRDMSPSGSVNIVYYAQKNERTIGQYQRIERALRTRTARQVNVLFYEAAQTSEGHARFLMEFSRMQPLAVVAPIFDLPLIARKQNIDIPLVIAGWPDPVGFGVIESYEKPGRDVTGYTMFVDLDEKRLSILREIAPRATRIGVLMDEYQTMQRRARDRGRLEFSVEGASVTPFLVKNLDEMLATIRRQSKAGTNAWYIPGMPFTRDLESQKRVVEEVNAFGLPAIFDTLSSVNVGGLLAYEPYLPDRESLWIRTLQLLVEGMPAREIPFMRPHHFFMTMNTETLQRLNLSPSAGFLRQIDQTYPCSAYPPLNCKTPPLR
jgi:putative tryptophan/tyrosine transport system substrate-binding protein